MSLETIRVLVDELRALQQRVSAATRDQTPNWRQDVVAARREIASRIGELSALTRSWQAPDHLATLYDAFSEGVRSVRRALALHQAMWPAVSIDPARREFAASVGEIRTAYATLLGQLDTLEKAASGKQSENLT